MWWVYIPAIVIESQGIIAAFGRSRELTRGRRWHILGLILIVGVIALVISYIIGQALQDTTGQVSTVGAIIQYAFLSVLTAFSSVLVAGATTTCARKKKART
jgi:Membrane domain of glycerophosphoryl diester phosphodiesterase